MKIESPDPERLLDVVASVYGISGKVEGGAVAFPPDTDPDLQRWLLVDWPDLVSRPPASGDGGMAVLLDTRKPT
jgi:hypothetical protein